MKVFNININDEGQRLNKFLEKVSFKLPKSLMYKKIRKKEVKINSKPVAANYILKLGDVLTIYGLDEFFTQKDEEREIKIVKKEVKLDIIYEDENILVVNKKRGIKTQPDSEKKDSLIDFVLKYLVSEKKYDITKEKSFKPATCNRLDFNTKGLVLIGKNFKALRTLNSLMADGKIKKSYICEVEGIVKKKKEILYGFWSKDFKNNKVLITFNERKNSKKVITEYMLIKQFKDRSLLKVLLHTGKSHQIRAHMALIGHPIDGDFKYGSTKKEPQKLTCCGLKFNSKNTSLSYLDGKEITLKEEFN